MLTSRAPVVVVVALAALAGANVAGQADYYYYGGKPVPLTRSPTECVVSFRSGATEEQRLLVAGVSSSARLGNEIRNEDRVFHIVTIPAVTDGGSIAQFVTQLQRADGVEFVAPVFYGDGGRPRMFPTGEIVVKLRSGDTRQHLTDLVRSRNMVIVKMMPGTNNEYVLRSANPKETDPIGESRLLHETGLFEWVHPNFIQEFARLRNVSAAQPVRPTVHLRSNAMFSTRRGDSWGV